MAAKDYIFAQGMVDMYLTKILKRKPYLMSEDRRKIEDCECLLIAHYYLKKKCKELKTDNIVIRDGDGNDLFSMKLLKIEEE